MDNSYKLKMAGDCAITVEFENEISVEVNNQVAILKSAVESCRTEGILKCIPTYRSLLIQYNPLVISYDILIDTISDLINMEVSSRQNDAKVYVIPVYYGDEYGPDLNYVASTNQLSEEDVIQIHTSVDYRIYMLGFTPGFPYLGGMDESIATQRLSQPRTKIHAGSVGIADKQTGIYPIDSPGGWQIIGRTPLKLFDIDRKDPILLEAGNYIRFKSVDYETYQNIENQVNQNTYVLEIKKITRGGV